MVNTRKELCCIYGLSENTIRKRLSEIGISNRKRLNCKEIKVIFEEFGNPNE